MPIIQSVTFRKVLNSHAEFTSEYIVELESGALGIAASPKGETISIYEDRKVSASAQQLIAALEQDCLGEEMEQADFDQWLHNRINRFGRDNCFALSLAFFNATTVHTSVLELWDKEEQALNPPHLCLNFLNGGWHAYTNPVLSDFPEFLLVSRAGRVEEAILKHHELQRRVREKLLQQPYETVGGNPVHRFATADNRE
jgi:enolase